MKINNAILSLIKEFEGFKHLAYICPAGMETIGYGHVLSDAEKSKYKDGISEKQAFDLLLEDYKEAFDQISRVVKVSLNENQMGALVSLVFNIGIGTFSKSRGLDYINKKDFINAKRELFDSKIGFVKVNKVILPGLVRRRLAESKLWDLHV
jgi:lysozyme